MTRSGRQRGAFSAVASAALAASVLAGAGPAAGSSEPSEPSAGSADVDRDAEFNYAISFGFNGLDPHRSPSVGDALWLRPIYDRLFTIDNTPDGAELIPQLATSYEYSDDGLSVTFELRDDVEFQDGAHFDADAVKANIERATDAESTVSSFLATVETVEVVDPTHVVFHLTERDPSLPWALAQGTTGMMVSPDALGNADLGEHPVGSGPYSLVSAEKDAAVVYERWDDHWDADAGWVQQLTLSTIGDVNPRFNGTRSGDFDAAYLASPADAEAQSLTSEGFHWVQALSPVSWSLLLNSSMPPLDDVRVRQAISMALDRQAISETVLAGLNPPAYQQFLEGYIGHDPELDVDPYDPDAARALIDDAGATDATIEMVQNVTPPGAALAEVAQQALGEIGLNVELVPVGASEATPAWRTGDYHASMNNNAAQAAPSLSLSIGYFGQQNPAEPPAELAELADEAAALPVGSPEQEAAYQAISAYLVENPIFVPVAQFTTVHLCRPEIVGCESLNELGQLDFRHIGVSSE